MADDFSVVAIIAAYNEADIISAIVRDLIDQGISVCFLDDGSTDGTIEAVEPYAGHGVIRIERLRPATDARSSPFNWEQVLQRKAQLASEIDADWFIHHDADELRESPWADVPLKEAIRRVDAMGYNAIDFASLDFQPTDDRFRGGDLRAAFPFYSDGAPYDKVQIRCWKKTSAGVDLASTGGHEARFEGRKVFPIRFLLRHYPIRGQAHGDRKVFLERQPRFVEQERARGWHVQYDRFAEGNTFVQDPCTLTRFDPVAVRIDLSMRHRGVEALEQSNEAVHVELETARKGIEQLKTAGLALQQVLEKREEELHDTRSQLNTVRVNLVDKVNELTNAHSELVARRDEIAGLNGAVAGLNGALQQRKIEVDNLQAAVADLMKQLDAIRHSLSWRFMTPARAVLRLLRGR